VLPDALEKHCIQAEPILDKNALAGKKVASAHLPLWICRRFSTDAAVYRRFASRLACLRMQRLPPFASQHPLSARFVVLFCTGVGFATFFLKTKKHASSVGSFLQTLWAGLSVCLCIGCQRSLVSIQFSARSCHPSFHQCLLATFFLKTKSARAVLALPFAWFFLLPGPSFWLALFGIEAGFSTRSRFLVLVNL
jgi:hypothetical protein